MNHSNLPKIAGIYELVHRASGRRYIGSSKTIRSRVGRHLHDLRMGSHHSVFLQRLYSKYGEDAFEARVVAPSPGGACLLFQEQVFINLNASLGRLLNTCKVAGRCDGIKQSEATKAKRAESLRRCVRPANFGALISQAKKGVSTPAMRAATKASGEARRFRLTEAQAEEIIEKNKSGVEMSKIYSALGVTHHPVLREIKRHFPKFKAARHKNCNGKLKGEQHGMAVLTWAKVADIRASKLPHKVLSEKYGVTFNHIGDIKRMRCWKSE